jgi:hypothetical protein
MSKRSEAADRPGDSQALAVRPAAGAWGSLLRHDTSAQATTMRRELGLPVDRPLIMTGHQVEFWHPGILAKYMAADAAARTLGAGTAWILVDQDAQPTVQVRYPARDAEGRLVVRTREYSAAGASPLSPHDDIAPLVAAGLANIEEAMSRHRDEPVLVRRAAGALRDLMMPLLSDEPACIFATELGKTTLFGALVERMRQDPEQLCATYNAAVARHPSAGVRSLVVNEVQDRYELPLWHITPAGARQRMYAELLDEVPAEALAPRALLMTGLLRLAACDLFIHGTGGGGADEAREGYDRVTEEWLIAWLDMPRESLAPATVVTATLRLPLSERPLPTRAEVAQSTWRAHHARHDPASIGDRGGAEYKRMLVASLSAMRREADGEGGRGAGGASRERALLFERLHDFLSAYREQHRDELAGLALEAGHLRRRLEESAILLDRTWPFPLYPGSSLQELRARIDEAFAQDDNRGLRGAQR